MVIFCYYKDGTISESYCTINKKRQIQTRKEVQLVFNKQQNFECYYMCKKVSVGVDYFGSVRHHYTFYSKTCRLRKIVPTMTLSFLC